MPIIKIKLCSAVRVLLLLVSPVLPMSVMADHHIWTDGDENSIRDDIEKSIKKLKLSESERLATGNYIKSVSTLFANHDASPEVVSENVKNVYRAQYCFSKVKMKPETLLAIFELTIDSDARRKTFEELVKKGEPYGNHSQYRNCTLIFSEQLTKN